MKLSDDQKRELDELLSEWFRSRGLVSVDTRVVVSIQFESACPVEVRVQSTKQTCPDEILLRVLRKMINSTRMANALANANIVTIPQLRAHSPEEILNQRNVGSKTLRDFLDCLKEEGAGWPEAEHLLRPSLYSEELSRCVVRELKESDWSRMFDVLDDRRKLDVIRKLQKVGNKPIIADHVLYESENGALKLDSMRVINNRFKRYRLPYRLKLDSVPPHATPSSGLVRVAVLPGSS